MITIIPMMDMSMRMVRTIVNGAILIRIARVKSIPTMYGDLRKCQVTNMHWHQWVHLVIISRVSLFLLDRSL